MNSKLKKFIQSEKFHWHYKPWVLILGILIGIYLVLSWLIMPIYTRHWQRVIVPDVTNLSVQAAEKLLKRQKLETIAQDIKFDERMPNGFVVFQSPTPGAVVKKHRHVYLTLSKGKRPINMPNLVGTAERDARFTIDQNQLVLGEVKYEFDSYYPTGVVIKQSIAANSEINTGAEVDLVVSQGTEGASVIVPNVVGKTFDEANMFIQIAKMSLGKVRYTEMPDEPDDVVLLQSPEAGLRVAAGDSVDLVLSASPQDSVETIP
ncbi:MAG: PASTA domain-containing protein [Calditrichaeota bacterium]|nr:MAG: PASTA domain-containing protein [Calditrichota bacterium]